MSWEFGRSGSRLKNAMKTLDKRLREVEQEIDSTYLSNVLVNDCRPTAMWNLLSVFEDWTLGPLLQNLGVHQYGAAVDERVRALKHAVAWVFHICSPDRCVDTSATDRRYKAAVDLLELAKNYDLFEAISLLSGYKPNRISWLGIAWCVSL